MAKHRALDLVRTRAWSSFCAAHCAYNLPNHNFGKKASLGKLSAAVEDYRERKGLQGGIDKGRWSLYLRGSKPATSPTVDECEKIWAGSKRIFLIGPLNSPLEVSDLIWSSLGTEIPLWSALKGDVRGISRDWASVPSQAWEHLINLETSKTDDPFSGFEDVSNYIPSYGTFLNQSSAGKFLKFLSNNTNDTIVKLHSIISYSVIFNENIYLKENLNDDSLNKIDEIYKTYGISLDLIISVAKKAGISIEYGRNSRQERVLNEGENWEKTFQKATAWVYEGGDLEI